MVLALLVARRHANAPEEPLADDVPGTGVVAASVGTVAGADGRRLPAAPQPEAAANAPITAGQTDKTASERPLFEKTASERAASERTALEKGGSERSASERTAFERLASERSTVEKTVAGPPALETPALETTRAAANPDASAPPASRPRGEEADLVTITGCLASDDQTLVLKDTSGTNVPTTRSWKSGFLKRRPAQIEIVGAASGVGLPSHVGHLVTITGTIVDREMQVRSLQRVAAACKA